MLNAPAAEAMRLVGVHACTDITGFGLLGHLREMAVNSGVDVEIELASLPLLPKAKKFAEEGLIPGGAYRNKEYLKDHVEIGGRISPAEEDLLYDPQTSGGLLIAVSGEKREQLLSALREKGVASPRAVGRVTGRGKGRILVRGV